MATLGERAAAAVSAVCPHIIGLSIPNRADKSTWRLAFADAATEAERSAAVAALAGVDASLPDEPDQAPAQPAKDEARRRLVAMLKDGQTQINLAVLQSSLTVKRLLGEATQQDLADLATLRAMQTWVAATLAHGRALAAAGATDLGTDETWPGVPPGLPALVARL